jgi:hypothetical protein
MLGAATALPDRAMQIEDDAGRRDVAHAGTFDVVLSSFSFGVDYLSQGGRNTYGRSSRDRVEARVQLPKLARLE